MLPTVPMLRSTVQLDAGTPPPASTVLSGTGKEPPDKSTKGTDDREGNSTLEGEFVPSCEDETSADDDCSDDTDSVVILASDIGPALEAIALGNDMTVTGTFGPKLLAEIALLVVDAST